MVCTEEVGDRVDSAADKSLCNGRDGVDVPDIVSWPSPEALSAILTGFSSL